MIMRDAMVLGIVREYAKGPAASLDARFDDMDIDSLEFIQIVREVEEAFRVRIPDGSLAQIHTIRELIAEALRSPSS